MVITNKQTRKNREISFSDFKKEFSKEIQVAFESYKKLELNKNHKIFSDTSLESDFYFDFLWNFNHLSNSIWYIKSM